MSRGCFITFEGTEGGGKSTQIGRLAAGLRAGGREVVELREPGGTSIGEEIRHLLKHSDASQNMTAETELLLICASRAQLVREVIRPALAAGKFVLCDRFCDSTVAYQGYGRGLELDRVRRVIDFAVGETRPDLTLYLRVPVSVSEERRRRRIEKSGEPRDRFEESNDEFFRRVEKGFECVAAEEPGRVVIIDGTLSIDEVQSRIRDVVQDRLKWLFPHHSANTK